jgi:hypothetical protein
METMVSYCGLICQGCPIYWATNEKDDEKKEKMRVEIAKMSNDQYKTNLSPKEIADCDGCRHKNGRIFPSCINCYIRNCAQTKNLINCAYCEDYACDELNKFFIDNTDSKMRLNFIHALLH